MERFELLARCAFGGLGIAALLGAGVGCGGSDAESPATAGSAGAALGGGGNGGSASGGAGSSAVGGSSAGSAGATAGSGGASAGTGGSAGASGAAAGGSAGSAGSSGSPSCVNGGSELCDDFESGKLDTQWAVSKSGTASVTVETGLAHSGHYAAHFKFEAGKQSNVTIGEGATFAVSAANPTPANKFYSRMYAYFGPEIPKAATGDFHTGFMVGSGKNDKGDVTAGMGMIGSDGQYLGYSIFFGTPKYEFGPWSKPRILAKQWLCIEMLEDGSDANTEVRKVWLNDVEMTELQSDSAKAGGTANPNHHPPKFDKVSFGIIEYHPIPTLSDMWIDDIRVSPNKIGCLP